MFVINGLYCSWISNSVGIEAFKGVCHLEYYPIVDDFVVVN
jgi:hypothetical protein